MAAAAAFRALVLGLLVGASRGRSEENCVGEESCQAVAEEEVAELATPLLQTGKTRQAQPSADAGSDVEPVALITANLSALEAAKAFKGAACITKNCVCDSTVTCCFGTHCVPGWGGMMRCLFDVTPTDTSDQDPEKCVCDPPSGYGMGIANALLPGEEKKNADASTDVDASANADASADTEVRADADASANADDVASASADTTA